MRQVIYINLGSIQIREILTSSAFIDGSKAVTENISSPSARRGVLRKEPDPGRASPFFSHIVCCSIRITDHTILSHNIIPPFSCSPAFRPRPIMTSCIQVLENHLVILKKRKKKEAYCPSLGCSQYYIATLETHLISVFLFFPLLSIPNFSRLSNLRYSYPQLALLSILLELRLLAFYLIPLWQNFSFTLLGHFLLSVTTL